MLCRRAKLAYRSQHLLWRRTVTVVMEGYSLQHTEPPEQSPTAVSRVRRLDTWTRFFDQEQRFSFTPRIEKINVEYVGKLGEPTSLRMTKGISTPIDCAKHLSQLLEDRSAVALVDGQPWDMHRPLLENCQLDFVHFKDAYHDPTVANEAFWRSSAFLMAATLESVFRPEHRVRLLNLSNSNSSPSNGAFTCDISFTPGSAEMGWWQPSWMELQAISRHGQRLAARGLAFQVVDMPVSLVNSELFGEEPLRHIEAQRKLDDGGSGDLVVSVPVYRMGDYVEVCTGGPLITSTKLIGRFAVARLYPLGWLANHQAGGQQAPGRLVYRAHGLALPNAFLTHFTTFDRLIRWAEEEERGEVDSLLPDYVVPI